MKQEPIAWWYGKYEDETDDFMYPETREQHIKIGSVTPAFYPIPLYTASPSEVCSAPKQLSDEEILGLWNDWGQMITIDQQKLFFARAVLKKASEK